MRNKPNILITGTPGTGKSSLAEMLMHEIDGMKHLNVSEIIKERKLADRFNEEWNTWEFDDDKAFDSGKLQLTLNRSWIVWNRRWRKEDVFWISILAKCFLRAGLT